MENILKKFEQIIIIALLVMMGIVVIISTVELAVIIVKHIVINPPGFLLDINELLTIFGFFLMILIGIELVETLKAYLIDEIVHVETVFLVAIIAITRKVIILDFKSMDPLSLIGTALLILALSGGYYLLKKALNMKKE